MKARRVWLAEMRRVVAVIGGAALLGWLFSYPTLGLAAGLSMVLLIWSYQLSLVQRWLDKPEDEPPESHGLWGLILDNIHLFQRRSREAQLRLASALDYLQDSLASMRDAAIIVDARGAIAWSNASAQVLLGIRFPEDRGQLLLNLIRMPQFVEYYEAENYSSPLRILPSAESDDCLQIEISRFGEGDRLLFVRDITETFRLEQMRRDFVSNVSHELRTPLTVIKGYVDTLIDMEPFATGPLRRPLEQINEQSDRMESLLKDLLWLGRIESAEKQIKTELVDVPKMLEELASQLRTAWPDRDLVLKIDTQNHIVGDDNELHSAFSNLVINALKYSESGPVIVRWQTEQEVAVFSVADCGTGIAQEHLTRLTERFYRIDKSRSQTTGGTGLGLAIVKHVANSHNADLAITSHIGEGSTFSLRFPNCVTP